MAGCGKDYSRRVRTIFVWSDHRFRPLPTSSRYVRQASAQSLHHSLAMTSVTFRVKARAVLEPQKKLKTSSDKSRNSTRKPWKYYVWQVSQKTGSRTRVTVVVRPKASYAPTAARSKKGVVVISRLPRQKVIRGRMRLLRKRAIPFTNPYTRTQSIRRRVVRFSKNMQPLSSPANESSNFYTYSKTYTGSSLPKWRQIIRAGGNATTTFSAGEDVLELKDGSIEITYQSRLNASSPWELYQSLDSSFGNYVTVTPIGHFTSGADSEAQIRATRELYKKIYQARHQLQGGVILGEIDKSARMLVGAARSLKQGVIRYLFTAKRIRQKKTWTNISKRKAIANTYLESVYGWQPLLMDMKDLAKTLGRLCHESDKVRFRAFGSSAVQAATSSLEVRNGNLVARVNRTDITETSVIYRGVFRSLPYEIGSPPLERIIQMSGFDLRSFVPTMWELVPYSFLVDYFSNIGDCLYALSCDTSIVQVLWRTQVKESTRLYSVVPDLKKSIDLHKSSGGLNVMNFVGSKGDGSTTIKRRDVSRAQAGVPIMVPRLTGLDLPWKQFANIGALITSKSTRI